MEILIKPIPGLDFLYARILLTLLPHSESVNFNGINLAKILNAHS
jgi:hypothetical protein